MAREASFWTAEKDAAAQVLWRKGLSGREVARLIGAPSHSAVIGRMWRLGAKRSGLVAATNHRAVAGVLRAMSRPTDSLKGMNCGASAKRRSRAVGGPLVAEAPLPVQTPVLCAPRPWLSREDHECAYPVAGEGQGVLSCCNTPVRRGYCEGHRAAMFRTPRGSLAWVLNVEDRRVAPAGGRA